VRSCYISYLCMYADFPATPRQAELGTVRKATTYVGIMSFCRWEGRSLAISVKTKKSLPLDS